MKILVLNYEYPPLGGGGASVCRDLVEEMALAGHHITVVTMGFRGLPDYEQDGNTKIIRLDCLRTREHACSQPEALSYVAAAIVFLKKHLRDHHYDVCHTHFILPTGAVALWAKTHIGLPYLITAHGSDVEGHNTKTSIRLVHRMMRPYWKQIVRQSAGVVVPSEPLMNLIRKAMPDGRFILLPNGLRLEEYKTDAEEKKHRILLLGRMRKEKSIVTVLKAISAISSDEWGDWNVEILGDGPERENLEHITEALHIKQRVAFRGWVENGSPEYKDALKQAAIFVSASHFENCPMAVLEAIASGCRPLLSDIDGHRQFFRNTENAEQFFFPTDREDLLEEQLRNQMKQVHSGKPIHIDLSKYSLEMVCHRYLEELGKNKNIR